MVLPTSGTISISDINSCARFTNGNMGINTTSPNYNLDINGTLKATTITTGTILATTSISSGAVNATNSTVTNMVATNVSSGTLNLSTGLTAGTILATTSISSGAVNATNSTVTNMVATNVSSGTLNLNTGLTAGTILATTSISSGAVNATNSTVTNMVATNVSSGTLNLSTGLTAGTILATTSISSGAVNATNSTITNFVVTSNTVTNMVATNSTLSNIYSTLSSIGTLRTDLGVMSDSIMVKASILTSLTVPSLLASTSLLAIGNSNTVGSIFTTGGNVGIGTTSPNVALDIHNSTLNSNAPFLRLRNSLGGTNNQVGIRLSPYSSRAGGDTSQIIAQDDGNASSHLLFCTASSGATSTSTERMRITNNGNVGINTTSPSERLTVNGNTDLFGTLRVGANSSSAGFLINLGTSGLGSYRGAYLYGDGTNILFSNQQNGGINFATNNIANRLIIGANGRVTIGGFDGSYPLTVFGSSNSGSIGGYAAWSGNYAWQNQTTSYDVSIYSQNFMMAGQGFVSVSDQRIKKDIIDIEDGESLNILRQIEPKRYHYIDEYKRGTDYVYGFIAQQVRGVLPAASGLVKDFIPSIMTSATVSYDSENDITTVTLVDNKQHNLTSENSNSRVRFFDENDKNTELELHEIVSGDIFKVKGELKDANTFVYGVEVDDFHTLNKDAIFTVALSALQQVDRELQETKQTVNDLVQRIQALENAN